MAKAQNIPGIKDNFIYRQNDEGKYSFANIDDEFDTGFIFDSFKVLNRNLILVSQKKEEGEKYGVISVCEKGFYLNCMFDKIKPYSEDYFLGKKNNKDFYISRYGGVFILELMELRDKYK